LWYDSTPSLVSALYNIHHQPTANNSAAFQTLLLYDQWSRDPDAKRPHSKVHGVISFHGLAKRIAKSWSVLPRAVKDVFYAIAKKDTERYSMKP
jgi:hypothetical protein